jgi:hypothetical protein
VCGKGHAAFYCDAACQRTGRSARGHKDECAAAVARQRELQADVDRSTAAAAARTAKMRFTDSLTGGLPPPPPPPPPLSPRCSSTRRAREATK